MHSFWALILSCTLIGAGIMAPNPALASDDYEAAKQAGHPVLAQSLQGAAISDHIGAFLTMEDPRGALTAQQAGHLLMMLGHPGPAAVYFGLDAGRGSPTTAARRLTNLSAALSALNESDPATYGEPIAVWAMWAALDALEHDFKYGPANNAAAVAAVQLSRYASDPDRALRLALQNIERATRADRKEPVYWANKAMILARMDAKKDAGLALKIAQAVAPGSRSSQRAAIALGQAPSGPTDTATEGTAQSTAASCAIDFQCPRVCAGKGISTGPAITSCKLHESDAELACKAGKPFFTAFDCDAEVATNAGSGGDRFKVCMPKICVTFSTGPDGRQTVEVEGEAGTKFLNPYFTAGLAQTPGGYRVTKFESGVRASLGDAGALAGVPDQAIPLVNFEDGPPPGPDDMQTGVILAAVPLEN